MSDATTTEPRAARIQSYAQSLADIAKAEGCLDEVADEVFKFSQAIAGNDQLRETLADRKIPVARRQQIVEDLLSEQARPVTAGFVSMLVLAERIGELSDVARALADRAAQLKSAEVAYVRTAVALSPEQISRLEQSLGEAVGKTIEVKASVDPNVLGGVVATIGDMVIDGSVKSRLAKLKDALV